MKKVLLLLVLKGITFTATAQEAGAGAALPLPGTNAPGGSRLAVLLGGEQRDAFPRVTAPRAFSFPADHGPHPEYRNEWWYITGNLDDAEKRRVGFELTLFRFALAPIGSSLRKPGSTWRADQVYVGHFAVTDVATGTFHAVQHMARGAAGLAGAQADPLRIWLEDWSLAATENGATWQLHAQSDQFALDLQLVPEKAPVANGRDGYSRKSAEDGNASYYYSMPRLATSGSVVTPQGRRTVTGLSWLDREWGSSALASYQSGWDWFALQLSDGRDVMFYNLRRSDGSQDPYSAGTISEANGATRHLAAGDVVIRPVRFWENAAGDRYPVRWELGVPSEQLDLTVSAILDNQELVTVVRYWEGAVDVEGTRGRERISGRGYVELTGYSDP